HERLASIPSLESLHETLACGPQPRHVALYRSPDLIEVDPQIRVSFTAEWPPSIQSLERDGPAPAPSRSELECPTGLRVPRRAHQGTMDSCLARRSEERRVGKECGSQRGRCGSSKNDAGDE